MHSTLKLAGYFFLEPRLNEDLLGEHFAAREFRCKCGTCGLGLESMQPDFLRRLAYARGLSTAPFVITSSIRCLAHNAAVGGVDSSAHVGGWAADIAANNGIERYEIVCAAMDAGFERIGVAARFVHIDSDPEKPEQVIWTY